MIKILGKINKLVGIATPLKVLFNQKMEKQMANLPVDRDSNYMYDRWGTNRLITDYGSMKFIHEEKKEFIQEIMDYEQQAHDLKKQNKLHEKIRNDEDYDDWEYGTEPAYGSPWN
jgi:hypothetical protein